MESKSKKIATNDVIRTLVAHISNTKRILNKIDEQITQCLANKTVIEQKINEYTNQYTLFCQDACVHICQCLNDNVTPEQLLDKELESECCTNTSELKCKIDFLTKQLTKIDDQLTHYYSVKQKTYIDLNNLTNEYKNKVTEILNE